MSKSELTAALDEIRSHHRQHISASWPEPGICISRDDRVGWPCATATLLAALDEVLKLHVHAVIEDAKPPFHYCSRCSGHPVWPCPEVAAISRHLLGGKP